VRDATTPEGTDVHFDAPSPTGGREPYNVQCESGSGSIFAIGENTVKCTATDADMARASCEFAVTVRVLQTLAKTRFVAFGDSITEGAVTLAPRLMLEGPETYPFKLEQMLLQRNPSQAIVVVNEGKGGETTPRGALRLPSVISAHQPEVVLLFEGVNNINGLSTSTQASALRAMIMEAQGRNVQVIIATILPMLPASGQYRPTTAAKIQALNAEIFALAVQHNLGSPVDLFAIFEASPGLMGSDGLHPSAQGQTRIAEAFRDEIVRRYDNRSTTSLHFSTMRSTR